MNIDSPYVAKAVLTSKSIIFVLFSFWMTTEIKAVCVFKRSKIYKHRAQGSQSHKRCFPEGIYLGEVTEVLLSSSTEGNQSEILTLCCKWALQGLPVFMGFAKCTDY